MNARICSAACLALAAGWTVAASAQGPVKTEEKGTTVAVTGCIARAAANAASQDQGMKTEVAGKFIMTGAKTTTVGMSAVAAKMASDVKPPSSDRYNLNGSDSMLAPYVGHQVELTGMVQTAAAMGGAAGKNGPMLTVDSVRMLEGTCP